MRSYLCCMKGIRINLSVLTCKKNYTSLILRRKLSNESESQFFNKIDKIREKAKNKRRSYDLNISFTSFLICMSISFVVYVAIAKYEKKKQRLIEQHNYRNLHLSSIGGPINLVDQDNKPITDEKFRGKFSLLYFGFTNCPDVCPDTLDKLTAIYNILTNEMKYDFNIIFITVDPKRDDPETVKEYIKEFHPNFLGLTGTIEQIDEVKKGFRIFSAENQPDETNDYLVDHTSLIYLMSPNWKFVDYYALDMTDNEILKNIKLHIDRYYSRY